MYNSKKAQTLAISDDSEIDITGAIDFAEQHIFERQSTATYQDILRAALERNKRAELPLNKLKNALKNRPFLHNENDYNEITTIDAIKTEATIVNIVKSGKDKHDIIANLNNKAVESLSLSDEQLTAVKTILSSKDFVTIFRGRAGTGKSYTLSSLRASLVKAKLNLEVCAPQAQQVSDLQKDGFTNAKTLASFLYTKNIEKNSVIIVDEAGQISGKQMVMLLELAHQNNCRVILSGDTKQHGSVDAIDALSVIEKYCNATTAELKTIIRQDHNLATSSAETNSMLATR